MSFDGTRGNLGKSFKDAQSVLHGTGESVGVAVGSAEAVSYKRGATHETQTPQQHLFHGFCSL